MPACLQGGRRRALVRFILPATLALALAATSLVTGSLGGTTRPAAATTASPSSTAIRYALGQLGDPYHYGSYGPAAWDCSGLTMMAFRAAGVSLPHTSRGQYSYGTAVYRTGWRPGDLIFWSSNGAASGIYHVGIFLGAGMVLHAPSSGRVVQVERIWGAGLLPYAKRIGSAGLLTVVPGGAGDRVRAVQQRLRANGFTRVTVTGFYDATTLTAAKRFQAAAGQPADGRIMTGTWATLVTHGVRAYVR
jgi:hypothetical protein